MRRLNWFSPLPPQKTDIGHFTGRIAGELMSAFDITFYTDLDYDPSLLPDGAKVKMFDPKSAPPPEILRDILQGVSVFNIGNDARFHSGISRWSKQIPGVSILHDLKLHHLFFEASRFDSPPFRSYVEKASALYGPQARAKAIKIARDNGLSIVEHLHDMPFFEEFTGSSLATICHSRYAQREIAATGATAIRLNLPFAASISSERRSWQAPNQLVAFGYMGPNRRLESIFGALSEGRDLSRFQLHIFGSLWDEKYCKSIAANLGVARQIIFHGYVSEAELDRAVSSSHLAFHLRHPSNGESSGGILRSWAHATPTLVTDVEGFGEFPETVTRKIAVDRDIENIQAVLRDLLEVPEKYRVMGLQAHQYLCSMHSPAAYVASLNKTLAHFPEWLVAYSQKVSVARLSRRCRSLSEFQAVNVRGQSAIKKLYSFSGFRGRLDD